MRVEAFFEKFEVLAEAPGGVGKLRELVLELAVRGSLSTPTKDGSEDPEQRNDIHRPVSTTDAAPDVAEVPFDIPPHWRWTTLERLGDTKPRNVAADSAASSFVPMALIPAEFGHSVQHEVRTWAAIKKGYTHIRNGDVVVAKITPCFENGKSAVVSGLTGGLGAGTTELHVFRNGSPEIIPTFAVIYLKTRGFITRGVPRMTGSAGQKRVPYDYFARAPFPLPPLAEQHRIVAKVDELMALCDQLEAQQREREERKTVLVQAALGRFGEAPTPANLHLLFHRSYDVAPAELRKAILTLAVQGKLVAQDPDDEPAEMTFCGLQSTGNDDCERCEVPANWRLCTYRSITSLVTSGSRGWKEYYSASGSIFIRTQNIRTDRLILDDVAWVDLPESTEGRRARVLKDDILITITGANVTKAARVEVFIPDAYVSQHIALTRPRWSDLSPWLHLCFVSHGSARARLEKLAYGDKPGLNLNHIRDLVLPIPPLAEQRRIVAKVDELMALVDALEAQLATARTAGSSLLDAVLAELTAA